MTFAPSCTLHPHYVKLKIFHTVCADKYHYEDLIFKDQIPELKSGILAFHYLSPFFKFSLFTCGTYCILLGILLKHA